MENLRKKLNSFKDWYHIDDKEIRGRFYRLSEFFDNYDDEDFIFIEETGIDKLLHDHFEWYEERREFIENEIEKGKELYYQNTKNELKNKIIVSHYNIENIEKINENKPLTKNEMKKFRHFENEISKIEEKLDDFDFVMNFYKYIGDYIFREFTNFCQDINTKEHREKNEGNFTCEIPVDTAPFLFHRNIPMTMKITGTMVDGKIFDLQLPTI